MPRTECVNRSWVAQVLHSSAALLRIAAPLLDPPPVDLDGLREQMGGTARTVRAIFERRVGGLSGTEER